MKMKEFELETLIANFFEGNTSEQEEALLKETFRNEEVPEHLQKEKRLFLSLFPDEEADKLPIGLEDRLVRMIDEKAQKERHLFRLNKVGRSWRWAGGVAATILLLVGIGYGLTDTGEKICLPVQDTYTDPEAAYKALQATLIEVSTNLNKGVEQIEETRMDVMEVNREVKNEILK